MSRSPEQSPAAARLVDVSDAVLEQLLTVAIRDADADEVTPALGSAAGWNSERIPLPRVQDWTCSPRVTAQHRTCPPDHRSGLDMFGCDFCRDRT